MKTYLDLSLFNDNKYQYKISLNYFWMIWWLTCLKIDYPVFLKRVIWITFACNSRSWYTDRSILSLVLPGCRELQASPLMIGSEYWHFAKSLDSLLQNSTDWWRHPIWSLTDMLVLQTHKTKKIELFFVSFQKCISKNFNAKK